MFGIGSTELLVILVVALVVLGPKSLASVSKSLGKAVGEFRRVSTDFQRTLNVEAAEEELKEAKKRQEAAAKEAETKATQKSDVAADQKTQPPVGFVAANASGQAGPPPDSPLGQAIARARIQAMQSENGTESIQADPRTETKA